MKKSHLIFALLFIANYFSAQNLHINGSRVGEIECDRNIYKDGSRIGECKNVRQDWVAAVVFFFFIEDLAY